jgi:alpha-tubulin suppressor-like RCC1 family protein
LALFTVRQVTCGDAFTAALTTTGKVYAFGDNTYGQLGDSTQFQRTQPVKAGSQNMDQDTIAVIASGSRHTLAAGNFGAVYAWGDSKFLFRLLTKYRYIWSNR